MQSSTVQWSTILYVANNAKHCNKMQKVQSNVYIWSLIILAEFICWRSIPIFPAIDDRVSIGIRLLFFLSLIHSFLHSLRRCSISNFVIKTLLTMLCQTSVQPEPSSPRNRFYTAPTAVDITHPIIIMCRVYGLPGEPFDPDQPCPIRLFHAMFKVVVFVVL